MFPIEKADPAVHGLLKNMLTGQYYRLIEPETKRVYDYRDGKLIDGGTCCYEIWSRTTPCGNCISSRALREKQPILKLEMAKEELYLACALPVSLAGQELSLEVAWNVTNSMASEGDSPAQNLLISDLVARFNVAVLQDAYTGLYNKRFAEEKLEEAVQNWTPENPLAVVLLDIDQFKLVNDTYGHSAGDAVIRELARILRECAEPLNGFACRIGGDEFLLILPGQSEQQSDGLLDEVETKLTDCTFDEKKPFSVSVSGGTAQYRKALGHWRALLDEADAVMYRVKEQKKAKGN